MIYMCVYVRIGEKETELGAEQRCTADGWCDLFHPSVYDFSGLFCHISRSLLPY